MFSQSPIVSLQEIVLKRAADLAEALYRSPPVPQNMPGFNTYTGQLSVSPGDNANGQWPTDGECRVSSVQWLIVTEPSLQGFSSRPRLGLHGCRVQGPGEQLLPGLRVPSLLPLHPLHLLPPPRLLK